MCKVEILPWNCMWGCLIVHPPLGNPRTSVTAHKQTLCYVTCTGGAMYLCFCFGPHPLRTLTGPNKSWGICCLVEGVHGITFFCVCKHYTVSLVPNHLELLAWSWIPIDWINITPIFICRSVSKKKKSLHGVSWRKTSWWVQQWRTGTKGRKRMKKKVLSRRSLHLRVMTITQNEDSEHWHLNWLHPQKQQSPGHLPAFSYPSLMKWCLWWLYDCIVVCFCQKRNRKPRQVSSGKLRIYCGENLQNNL